MSKKGDLRYRRKGQTKAALFWGQCILLLDTGRAEELRAIFVAKAKQRLEDVEELDRQIAPPVP